MQLQICEHSVLFLTDSRLEINRQSKTNTSNHNWDELFQRGLPLMIMCYVASTMYYIVSATYYIIFDMWCRLSIMCHVVSSMCYVVSIVCYIDSVMHHTLICNGVLSFTIHQVSGDVLLEYCCYPKEVTQSIFCVCTSVTPSSSKLIYWL